MGGRALSTAIILSLLMVIANLLAVGSPDQPHHLPATDTASPQPAAQPSNQQHHQSTQSEPAKEKHPFLSWAWLTKDAVDFFTFVLACFTGALVIVSAFQIGFLIRADQLARSSLIASQRAWIRRDQVFFTGPLEFRPDGLANTSVTLEFTNVGNAPALHVNMFAWLLPIGANGVVPHDRAKQLFAKVRKNPVSGGFTLFPGQAYPRTKGTRTHQGIHITKEEADAVCDAANRMVLYVAACINYSFATGPSVNHQTACLFEVLSSTGFITRTPGTSIPTANLQLDPSGFLGMDIAD
jgi:hypothetical protein